MQPWTDDTNPPPADRGVALLRLLDDVLPPARSALVLGPHDRAVLETVTARSEKVTLLLRSVSDAQTFETEMPGLNVVAGGLDGFVDARPGPFDVVIAADGLDRLLGADSTDLDWAARLGLVAKVA